MDLDKAVSNILDVCLGIKEEDRFLIVTDKESMFLGEPLYKEARERCPSLLLDIDEFGKRPLKDFPERMRLYIQEFSPTVSVYCAQAKEGELPGFRRPLIDYLQERFETRHAHMPGVSPQMVETGLSQDYRKIASFTEKVFEIVKSSRLIRVKDEHGTNLEIRLSPQLLWVKDTGIFRKPKEWGNLPAGEVFTCPDNVEGTLVAWELGDYFSEKYGKLSKPFVVEIKNSRVTRAECELKNIEKEFNEYIGLHENSNRAGEVAIGTLLGLRDLIGNLLQDEKFPGFHMAFGNPYPSLTGQKDWSAPTHIDLIALKPSIWVDDLQIMNKGEFTIN